MLTPKLRVQPWQSPFCQEPFVSNLSFYQLFIHEFILGKDPLCQEPFRSNTWTSIFGSRNMISIQDLMENLSKLKISQKNDFNKINFAMFKIIISKCPVFQLNASFYQWSWQSWSHTSVYNIISKLNIKTLKLNTLILWFMISIFLDLWWQTWSLVTNYLDSFQFNSNDLKIPYNILSWF